MDNASDGSKGLQSNEEVIEELTRDLKSSYIKVDEDAESKNTTDDSWDVLDKEQGNDSAQDAEPSDDAIEDLLKDRDLSLSEAEQEVRLHVLPLLYDYYYYYYVKIPCYICLLSQELKCEAEGLKQTGNDLFKNGEYVSAISQYTQALQICPLAYSKERSILHANRAAAKAKCQVLVENSY